MMTDFALPNMTIGNDILDIGSRKARRQRGDPMEMIPHATAMIGVPGQFDLPAVSNVSFPRLVKDTFFLYVIVVD
jgi:hypothetical protein